MAANPQNKMKTSFLQNPPYDRPVATLVNNIQLASVGRLLDSKRELEAEIRSIDARIRQQFSVLSGSVFSKGKRRRH